MTNFESIDNNPAEIGRLLHILIHTDQRTEALNYFRRKIRPQTAGNYPLVVQDMFELLQSRFDESRRSNSDNSQKSNGSSYDKPHLPDDFMRTVMNPDTFTSGYCELMRPYVAIFYLGKEQRKTIPEVENFLDQLIIANKRYGELSGPQQNFLRTVASNFRTWTLE